jgi:imidazolonepropionase-like amidohydrolase
MRPIDVIRAATINGAAAAGQDKDMGSIDVGKLANMVVLSRNPIDDVTALRSVAMTVKRGRQFIRADYRPAK